MSRTPTDETTPMVVGEEATMVRCNGTLTISTMAGTGPVDIDKIVAAADNHGVQVKLVHGGHTTVIIPDIDDDAPPREARLAADAVDRLSSELGFTAASVPNAYIQVRAAVCMALDLQAAGALATVQCYVAIRYNRTGTADEDAKVMVNVLAAAQSDTHRRCANVDSDTERMNAFVGHVREEVMQGREGGAI